MTFKSRLWQLEKEYLDAHLGKSCKGLGWMAAQVDERWMLRNVLERRLWQR
jgi:hypothetical protein